jgi:hypothetical protein
MAAAGDEVLARARLRDPSIDSRRQRFLRARDSFAVACFCVFDECAGNAWHYLRRSLALSTAPVLRSPRRWGVVGALVVLTILPRRAYRALLAIACRSFFGTAAGKPFDG